MSKNHLPLLLAAALTLPALVNCAAPDGDNDPECAEGRCDDRPDSEIPDSICDGVMVDHSGRGNKKVAGRLEDPVAKLVFREGDSCPKTYQDIMAKLRETDKEGCAGEEDGISTRLISETAQAAGTPTDYRAVVTRRCGGRETHGIVFSLFGIQAGATSLPKGVEIMAFDSTAGVFNYYETDGNKINFFGNSKDMLKGADGEDRRCAGCHTGGGLIMKELDTPWVHWEGHMDTPGARELVDAHKDFGSKNSGAELEGLVKNGNSKWNKTRLEFAKTDPDAVQALLKPLFCSVEVNLDNGADFESPVAGGPGGSQISGINFDSLLDPQLKSFGSVQIQFADYDAAIKANGQTVQGVPGAIDTVFDYVYPERSHADNDFVNQLKQAGIVDDDFIKDVVMVDFTRHVFSDDRCGLLTFAPKLEGADLTAEKIRAGFIANLESEEPAAGSPGAVLLANLKAAGDAAAHGTKVDTFINACKALGSKPFVENALAITSLNRDKARGLQVFEFAATMPSDNLNTNTAARFHPTTCQLTNSFVAP
jgi:hypothetical protein